MVNYKCCVILRISRFDDSFYKFDYNTKTGSFYRFQEFTMIFEIAKN